VILNPIKVPDPDEFRSKVDAALTERGFDDSLWLETTVDDAGETMAKRAVQETVDLVVVAGGDGTVRVVCAELARTDIPVAVLPAGTGNLLARNLGISLDLDTALAELLDGSEQRIDSVQVEGDQLGTDRFVVMAGLGLDAAIIADAPDELKKRVGWAAYVVSTLKNLNHPFVRVEIIVDDRPPLRRRARTVVIGNVGTLQANIPLLPDALPDDGMIDAVVLAPRRISHWPRLALSLVVKSMAEGRHIERFTGRTIQVTAAQTVRRQLDGDEISEGRTLTASVDPDALLVRVP
jgi:diacylglycerol kinase family enzyme